MKLNCDGLRDHLLYDGAEYKVAVEGKVIQRAECRPVENAGYMALKRLVVSTFSVFKCNVI